ncbi:MAG: hypothetical protein JST00_11555 [Deltaproteobacteria bacterium]|nr:hypothetical protein [Deltaproteobacteria bacterium]
MKGYATFFLISVMTLGLLFLLLTRSRTPHKAPAEEPEIAADAGDAGADGGDASVANADAALEAAAVVPAKPAERPIRIASLGWELAAAGVVLASPDGGVDAKMPPIEIAPETTLDAIEARLGRTGTDAVGADIAVLPLPAFVVAYDRVRRLDLKAFAVVGFSHGRDEVHASAGALTKAPPAADEVKLVSWAPATASDAAAKASGSESATVLGLFALDLLGVAPARVRFVAPGSADAKGASFAAIVRGATDERKLAFSTADAAGLVPIIAVAPKKLLDESEGKMKELTRSWLDGIARANKDASNVARRLANKEAVPLGAGVGGAPEAIALLDRLGQIEAVPLDKQRAYIGPDAKGPVTLEVLMTRTWQLAKAGGLTTAGAPEPLPIDARIAGSIAPAPPAQPSAPEAGDGGAADAGASATFAPLPTGSTPLVVYRAVDASIDAAAVASQIGFLSGVFEKAAFRVSAKGGEKAARAIATQARDRYGIAPARLATATAEPAGAFATVEIVSLP